jgi:hypothetical protein
MARKSMDLDVDAPDKVAQILRNASDAYYEGAAELESAWQDSKAGAPWIRIARILDSAADKIDKIK